MSASAADRREQLILAHPEVGRRPHPERAATVYVWPTMTCSIGCGHCNFASPRASLVPGRRRVAEQIDHVAAFVADMGPWKVALSGGGEPMDEPEAVYRFLELVSTPSLGEVEIITGGAFATTPSATRAALERMGAAFLSRDRTGTRLALRLSIDRFHIERIGLAPFVNILEAVDEMELDWLDVYARSVLVADDDSVPRLAEVIGASIEELDPYRQVLHLRSGRQVLIYSKNLIIDGRMTRSAMARRDVRLTHASKASVFLDRFLDADGRHVPARTYNGPSTVALDGLAMILEHDGSLKILEGNAPDRVPNVFEQTWTECLDHLFADPVTHFLVERGPLALAELVGAQGPDPLTVLEESNQLYYIVDRVLATPEARLVATERALEHHLDLRPS